MKIAIIHNRYAQPGRGSGEEVSLGNIEKLLSRKGYETPTFFRSSLALAGNGDRAKAFFSGIYNPTAKRQVAEFLAREAPNLVLVQNLFPLISPAVLLACREANIPVVMRCPNYRLLCPNGLFMVNGEICERCAGGHEYWAVLRNCEGSFPKSLGYALRSYVARQFNLFRDNVDVFMVQTEFAKRKLVEYGFPAGKIQVIYGNADSQTLPHSPDYQEGAYVGYVGRISPEKGIGLIIEAARELPGIPFKLAGEHDPGSTFMENVPGNIEFVGQLDRDALSRFYSHAKMIVVPSQWYEGLPSVLMEAMLSGKPIICSALGGMPEVVEHNRTGFLFPDDDAKKMTGQIQALWGDPDLCRRLGAAGREKVIREYSSEPFYNRLRAAFDMALLSTEAIRIENLD